MVQRNVANLDKKNCSQRDRGEFRGTGFKNYSRYTIRSTRFGGVELKKGFPDFACRELNRGHCEGGCGVERRLGLLVIKI